MRTIERFSFDSDVVDIGRQGNVPIAKVSNIHKLTKVLGYAKYINGSDGHIFIRGHARLHDTCLPSLARGVTNDESLRSRIGELRKFIREQPSSVSMLSRFPEEFHQPLYQHYGVNTQWVDLVDNIWVAIWFGMQEFISKKYDREYVYVKKRKVEGALYLSLVLIDAKTEVMPGYYTGTSHEMVDLRIGAPSIFLRPHAQHGILAKYKKCDAVAANDFMQHTCGIIEIDMHDAVDWMGQGHLLTHVNMFPSPIYDEGYAYLLAGANMPRSLELSLGTIKNYTLS